MEHSPEHENGARENVLTKIREKRVSMRPKLFFVLEGLLAGFVILVILAVTVALVSFILFGLRLNGHESLLGFGPRGVGSFLLLFPWPLLVLDALLVVFLERLLRRFKFGYRSPILYLLLGLCAVAVASGLLLDRGTNLNDELLRRADHGGLPSPFGELYEHMRTPAPHDRGIYRGTISEIATSSIRILYDDLDTDRDETGYLVTLPTGFDMTPFVIGERVYIAGDMKDGVIQAFGIRALPASEILRAPKP